MTFPQETASIHPRARHPCHSLKSSTTEGVVPGQWKRAITVPIPKPNPRNSLIDLRPISLTPIPFKILERIIAKELNHHQFRNIRGSSNVHYLTDLINYIISNADKRLEVTSGTVDLPKAFSLIDPTALMLVKQNNDTDKN
ncbi:uncharacterized protein LOC125039840 [Penaeus chinensis]|uniref:uncharacterized protein LOC125039840 n=1 Tax=Penaeus chinensis TaxID=139456 RepID=UPI001FB574B4|nr:uncharacterized protein LOC125039840 [Penaeus chinensis]